MSFFLSPIGNSQQIDSNGDPLNAGRVYTYLAGSTTPTATYTDNTGGTQQANPIILNSLGLPASPIWLGGSITYKFVIKDSTDVTLRTVDNISGINDTTATQTEWVASGFIPTFISTVSFSVPGDQTGTLQIGRRLRTQNTAGLIYSRITNSVFAATITTVTVVNDSGVLDSGLSAVSYGLAAPINPSLPNSAAVRTAMGVAASGANADITSVTALASINGGQIAGLRNKIINGAMAVDQRNSGVAQTITAAAALAYTVDRWYGYCTGANVTGQRVAGTAPNQYNYQYTGAASVTKIAHAQRIEAANSQDLAGTTATLAVDLANSLLTTVTWTAWYANTADTFGTLASPTRTQIATGTFTVTSTLTRYSTQISVPSAAITGIEIEFSVGAQISGTWTIGRAQFENGSVSTSFEYRSIIQEREFCQAYLPAYVVQTGNGDIQIGVGQAFGAGSAIVQFSFITTPRTPPTGVTVSNVGHFVLSAAGGGVITTTNVTFGGASLVSAELVVAVAAGLVSGNATLFRSGNASAQLLFTGCEL